MPRPKKKPLHALTPATPSAQLFTPATPSAQLLAEKPLTPATAKRLFDDSDDEEFHSAPQSPAIKINEEYARRFEHNKKREDLHRLEEKYGKGKASLKRMREESDDDEDDSEDASSSEDEDDIAVLATEKLDQEISATLEAIRKKDPRIYDGKSSFYSSIEESVAEIDTTTTKAQKPMFLRDYHRENLLKGIKEEDEEDSKDAPKTFVEEQADLKNSLVKQMHSVAGEEISGEDDDAFLVRKPEKKGKGKEKNREEDDLPDPSTADQNPEEYLNKFLASRAWTKGTGPGFVPLEEDDSEEDAAADEYEFNYNMRFEDPDAAARAKLISYGRDTVNAATVRREEKSSRKKAREEKRKRKEEEAAQREIEKGRLKKLKTEELMEKLKQVKEAADLEDVDEETEAAMLHKLLEGDFSDGGWDAWMAERFGDKYYQPEGKIKKPKFDDDIYIGDIVSDFEDDAVKDDADEDQDEEAGGVDIDVEMEESEETLAKKKPKKQLIKEKQEKKSKEKATRRRLERLVEDNYDFDAELPGSSKLTGFRYRETTPETYGLQPLDILAADDAELNQYAGLKKYASFRDPEKKKKDKKRYGKKKLLKQWRKEVFGSEKGIELAADWKPSGLVTKKDEAEAGKLDIREGGDGERKKKRRRKNKDKKTTA